MRVHLGSDHTGFALKAHMLHYLADHGYEPVDHGPNEFDPDDDYPPYCLRVAETTVADPGGLGIVIGGLGNAEQITANKVKGVRAALAWNIDMAKFARKHSDANVLAVGAQLHSQDEVVSFVEAFLTEPFGNEPEHVRRIEMVTRYEETEDIPPLPD